MKKYIFRVVSYVVVENAKDEETARSLAAMAVGNSITTEDGNAGPSPGSEIDTELVWDEENR